MSKRNKLLIAVYIFASTIILLVNISLYIYVIAAGALLAFLLFIYFVTSFELISQQLNELIPELNLFKSFIMSYPSYKYIDLFNAIEKYASEFKNVEIIDSAHLVELNDIINNAIDFDMDKINRAGKIPFKISYEDEMFVSSDRFWVFFSNGDKSFNSHIVRLRFNIYNRTSILEIAALNDDQVHEIKEKIDTVSVENSIFKNKLLNIVTVPEIKDEFGDIESSSEFRIEFMKSEIIRDEDIVLDDDVKRILESYMFNFHKNLSVLKEHGIPLSRGLLFYGPPGTGKSYTCKYIHSKLENITIIVATGTSLLDIKSICNVGKMLQPSIVVLEDVDLIFTSRDINLYSTALGDLMDQLDGFSIKDSVTFILTTNEIDRLEKAIKDRPGRINQSIYFDNPNEELRVRYIKNYIKDYDSSKLNIEKLSGKLEGASQAFLKELIYRAAQVCLEKNNYKKGTKIVLENSHFDEALNDILFYKDRVNYSIVGFNYSN